MVNELNKNVEEIQANLASTTLTEDPAIGRSFIAPNRLRPDHYKGMSPAEQAAVLAEQEAQRVHNAQAAAAAAAEKKFSDSTIEAIRMERCATEAMIAQKRAEERVRVMEENKSIAKEQTASQTFLNTQIYPNAVDACFFDQFNTTSR